MEVAKSKKGIYVSQRKYILDLLTKIGMLGYKPTDTPIVVQKKKRTPKKDEPDEGEDLSDDEVEERNNEPVDKYKHQRLVGRLIYLSHIRPDIAFTVSITSQYICDPRKKHMKAVYRILRYLKGTLGRGLFFKKSEQRTIEIYIDADWEGTHVDRRSTSRYCSFVWENLVTWKSQKTKGDLQE